MLSRVERLTSASPTAAARWRPRSPATAARCCPDGPAPRPRPGIRSTRCSGRRASRSAARRRRRRAGPCRRGPVFRTGRRAPRAPPRTRRRPAPPRRSLALRIAHDRFATAEHLRAVTVVVEVELVDAAVAVLDAALLELAASASCCSRSSRHGGGRLRLLARAERLPVVGARLVAPERAERRDAGALAARHADVAAASDIPSRRRPRTSGCRRWGRGSPADPRRPGRRSRRRRRCTSRPAAWARTRAHRVGCRAGVRSAGPASGRGARRAACRGAHPCARPGGPADGPWRRRRRCPCRSARARCARSQPRSTPGAQRDQQGSHAGMDTARPESRK